MSSDNGKDHIEPNTQQPEQGKIKIKPLLVISIGEDNHVYISGDTNNKELCFEAIAETIKFIAHYQPKVIQPRGGMMNFARRITGRR